MRRLFNVVICLCFGLVAGCGDKSPQQNEPVCGDGVLDSGEECDWGPANSDAPDAPCRTDCRARRCGDGIVDAFEQCDASALNGDTPDAPCRSNCRLPGCGDSIVDTDEECDEGLANSDITPDACRTNCRVPHCGDGVADTGEQCDNADDNSDSQPDACRSSCESPRCGDGVVDSAEDCDEGAANSDEAENQCRTNCQTPWCGDGVVDDQYSEQCDDGASNADQPDAICRTDCRPQRCGDGVVDTGETCDDGAANSDVTPDACRTDCTLAECGDGIVDALAGEECDDGPGNAQTVPNACRPGCLQPVCGDSIVDDGYGESCDGGTANSDLPDAICRTDCQPGRCGDAILDSGEICDQGTANADTPDAPCRTDCTPLRCGDAIVDSGESCDLGPNNSDQPNAGCRVSCELPWCGDGIVDDALGEVCDLGAANSDAPNESCRLDCSLQRCGDGVVDTGEECDLGASNVDGLASSCRSDCMANGAIPQPLDIMMLLEDPVRPRVYGLTWTDPSELIVIDANARVEATRILLAGLSNDMVMPPDGSVLVVGSLGWDEPIQVFQPDTMAKIDDLYVHGSRFLGINSAQTVYYTATWGTEDIYQVSVPGGAGTDTPLTWLSFYGGGIELSRDEQYLYTGECGLSGSDLSKYNLLNNTLVARTTHNDGYGFWYPRCDVYVCPRGDHVYYAGCQLDATNLRFKHGPFWETTFVEDQAGTFSVGEAAISDVETWLWVKEFPVTLTAAALSHQDRRLWYYSPDTGMLHYEHVADHLQGITLGQRARTPGALSDYNIIKLVHDPLRPLLYGLDYDRHVVVAIDTNTLQPVHEIVVGFNPYDADIDPTGTYLYVGHSYTSGIARLTLDPFAFDGWIAADDSPWQVAALNNHRVAAAARWDSRGPDLFDGLTGQKLSGWNLASYQAPTLPMLERSASGDDLFVAAAPVAGESVFADPVRIGVANNEWTLIDDSGGIPTIKTSWTLIPTPDDTALFQGTAKLDAHDLNQILISGFYELFYTITPDSGLIFSSTRVWDVNTLRQVGTLPVIGYVQAMSPNGSVLYVYDYWGELTAVDLTQYAPLPPLTGCGNGVLDAGEECDDGDTQAWDGCHDCLRQEFRLWVGGEYPEQGKIRLRANGEGVLAWMAERSTHDGYAVYYQRLDNTGGTVGGRHQANTAVLSDTQKFGVGLADDGRVVIGWQATQPPNLEPFIRRFDANDQALGADALVPVDTLFDHHFEDLVVGPTGNGIVVFDQDHDAGSSTYGTFGRRLSSSMSLTGGDLQLHTTTSEWERYARVATDANGNFVAVWTGMNIDVGGGNILYGQRFTAGGTKVGPEFVLHSTPEGRHHTPHVAMASDGKFAVTWVDWADPPPGPDLVWARIYGANGVPLGPEFLVNQALAGLHKEPRIGITDTGRVLVVFNRLPSEYLDGGIVMRWFDATGQPEMPEEIVNREYGFRHYPCLEVLGDGRTMLIWRHNPYYTDDIFLVGQRWDAAGNVLGRDPW